MNKNSESKDIKKKKYEKPRIYSEKIYERTVLTCGTKAGTACELNPPTST